MRTLRCSNVASAALGLRGALRASSALSRSPRILRHGQTVSFPRTRTHAHPTAACRRPRRRRPLTTVPSAPASCKTGRYDEVIALCAAFAQRYPDAVRCIDFGTTPEGRPMKALVVSRSGALTPEAAHAQGPAGDADPGRHPRRRDRRQGRRLPGAARGARRRGRARRARQAGAAVRAGVQRRRPRALRRAGTAPTSAARRRWAGAPPRRTTTSTATT